MCHLPFLLQKSGFLAAFGMLCPGLTPDQPTVLHVVLHSEVDDHGGAKLVDPLEHRTHSGPLRISRCQAVISSPRNAPGFSAALSTRAGLGNSPPQHRLSFSPHICLISKNKGDLDLQNVKAEFENPTGPAATFPILPPSHSIPSLHPLGDKGGIGFRWRTHPHVAWWHWGYSHRALPSPPTPPEPALSTMPTPSPRLRRDSDLRRGQRWP